MIDVRESVSETRIYYSVERAEASLYADGVRRNRGESTEEREKGREQAEEANDSEDEP